MWDMLAIRSRDDDAEVLASLEDARLGVPDGGVPSPRTPMSSGK
jgi:hypothetical protein